MIPHRIRAWLGRSDPAPAEDFNWGDRNAELEGQVKRLTTQVLDVQALLVESRARAMRLTKDLAAAQAVTAGECVCGGDTELYWRRRAARAETQAQRDRANANSWADRIALREGRPVIGRLR